MNGVQSQAEELMVSSFRIRFVRMALIIPVCLGIFSCHKNPTSPERYQLSGKALFDGMPIPDGTISFSPNSTKGNNGPGSMADIHQGKFVTRSGKGILGGPYTVIIYGYEGPQKPLFSAYEIDVDLPEGGVHDFLVPASAAKGIDVRKSPESSGGPI